MLTLAQKYRISPVSTDATENQQTAENLRDFFVDFIRTDGGLYTRTAVPLMMEFDKLPGLTVTERSHFLRKTKEHYSESISNVVMNLRSRGFVFAIEVEQFSASAVAQDVSSLLFDYYMQHYNEIKQSIEMIAKGNLRDYRSELSGARVGIKEPGHKHGNVFGYTLVTPYLYASMHPVKSVEVLPSNSLITNEVMVRTCYNNEMVCELLTQHPEKILSALKLESFNNTIGATAPFENFGLSL